MAFAGFNLAPAPALPYGLGLGTAPAALYLTIAKGAHQGFSLICYDVSGNPVAPVGRWVLESSAAGISWEAKITDNQVEWWLTEEESNIGPVNPIYLVAYDGSGRRHVFASGRLDVQ